MTLVSIPLMDRTGRRTLHLYGLGGMFIFSIFITISFLIKASKQIKNANIRREKRMFGHIIAQKGKYEIQIFSKCALWQLVRKLW